MKSTKLIAISCALAILPLVSCSIIHKTVKTETEMPEDRTTVVNDNNPTAYRSTAIERGEISGEWAIKTVNGNPAKGDMSPYILFDPNNGRIYGNNGCNTINGQYDVNPADSTLRFTDLITTMRLCPGESSEREINIALDKVRRYTWTFTPELAYTLDFLDADGNTLMTLLRQDFDFLNGAWRVASIKGEQQDNPDVVLVFDIAEQKIHGNTGCNVLNGHISIDMGERNSITLENIAVTRMMCPNIASETSLLVALEEVMYARPINANECELLDGEGHVVLTLARTTDVSD